MDGLLSRHAPWVVAVVAMLLYLPALGGGYVFDDRAALLGHPVVQGTAPLWETFVREFWGERIDAGWSSSYRPLTTLTFALEHRLTDAPWLHLGINVALFGVTCGVVTRIARRVGGAGPALLVGLGFAVLPIHVENVASIVGRADVLATLACLVAFELASSQAAGARRVGAVLGAALAYLTGLLCKESVALFPAILWWFGGLAVLRERPRRWSRLWPAIATSLLGAAYLALRSRLLDVDLPETFVRGQNPLEGVSGPLRLWANLTVLGHYAELSVIPLRLCVEHTYADVVVPQSLLGEHAAYAWLGLAILLFVLRDGYTAVRRRRGGYFVAAFLAYMLVGHWIIPLVVVVAERLAFWPLSWLAIAVASTLGPRWPPLRGRRVLGLAVAVVWVAMAARTVQRTLHWRDDYTLLSTSARMCPADVHTRYQLARHHRSRGESEDAVWHFAVAAAGRQRFPGPFEVTAFDVEGSMPLQQRLLALPELLEVADPEAFLWGLRDFLIYERAEREAALVERIIRARRGG